MTVDPNNILDVFLKQGLLGAFLVVALIAIYKLITKYDEIQEKRIAEGLANQKIMTELAQSVRDLTRALQDRGRRA